MVDAKDIYLCKAAPVAQDCLLYLHDAEIRNYTRTFTQMAGVKDTKVRLATRIRTKTDYVGVKDTKTKFATRIRTKTDYVGVKDTKTKFASRIRAYSDNVGVKDTKVRLATRIRDYADNVGVKDSKTKFASRIHTYLDKVGTKDSKVRLATRIRTYTDKVGIRDNFREQIINGGFEEGTGQTIVVGWTLYEDAEREKVYHHSGIWSQTTGALSGGAFKNTVNLNVPISSIKSFGFWYISGALHSYAYVRGNGAYSLEIPLPHKYDWTYFDWMEWMEKYKNPPYNATKVYGVTFIGGCIIDDVSLVADIPLFLHVYGRVRIFTNVVGIIDSKSKVAHRFKVYLQTLGVNDSKSKVAHRFRVYLQTLGVNEGGDEHGIIARLRHWLEHPKQKVTKK